MNSKLRRKHDLKQTVRKYAHQVYYFTLAFFFGAFYLFSGNVQEKLFLLPVMAVAFLGSFLINQRLHKEIQDRKRLEKALEYSESLFKGVFNNAAVGIALLNKDGYYQHVNLTFCRMIGYSQEKLRTMQFQDITYEEDLKDSIRLSNEIWEGKYPWRTGEKRYICENGAILWTEINLSSIHNNSGDLTDIIVVIVDITVKKKTEQELMLQATTDCLTGVDNRLAFMQKGQEEISRAIRYGRDLALLLLDVDYFKSVNDRHGHLAGDRVLKEITSACQAALRDTDILARIGGEEFAVILLESNRDTAQMTAVRVQQKVKELLVEVGDARVRVTVSIGIAVLKAQDKCLEDIFKRADDALYRAKSSGRNRIAFGDEA